MTTKNQEMPFESAGFLSDLAGLPSFLIDPEGAAKRVHSKWFWVAALLVVSAIAIGVGIFMAPIIIHVASVAPLPAGATQEARDRAVSFTTMAANYGPYFSPILAGIFWAIIAGVLMGISVVSGVTARFGEFFNLVAGCSIIQSLGSIATAIILHFKGDVSTQAELKPAMGLDIFLPEGTNKYLVAAGGSFSVFSIWWVVMMALIFAVAFRTSKGKAFAIVLPLWLIGMLLSMLGAIFQK